MGPQPLGPQDFQLARRFIAYAECCRWGGTPHMWYFAVDVSRELEPAAMRAAEDAAATKCVEGLRRMERPLWKRLVR